MAFCEQCGKELIPGSAFCNACGAPTAVQPAEQLYTPPAPVDTHSEEQEFLDWTHRLLRWERKAWSIGGKVFLILGIIYAALFALLGVIFLCIGDSFEEAMGLLYIWYSVLFGAMFIGIGVVGMKAADKIPFYLDNMYTDFRYAYDRCGSVGMLVFCVILGVVSPVFFIINFVRMKTNRRLIEKIIARQQS